MNDYAAAAIEPAVQGVLTSSSTVTVFQGRGVSAVSRTSAGLYVLTLDQALPGDLAVADAAAPTVNGTVVGSVIGNPRTLLTARTGSGGLNLLTLGVTYGTTANLGVTSLTVSASLASTVGGAGTDITGADASAVEVIMWKSAN